MRSNKNMYKGTISRLHMSLKRAQCLNWLKRSGNHPEAMLLKLSMNRKEMELRRHDFAPVLEAQAQQYALF
jgi:hypothetical protein